jgi:hypothetical protein
MAITKVYLDKELLDEYEDVTDENLDGTLRLSRGGYLVAEYSEDEWTHISQVDDDGNTIF